MSAHRRVRDLTDLAIVLWRGRWPIALATLAAALLTAVVSLALPKRYQAEVKLMISESKLSSSLSGGAIDAFFNPRLFHTFEGIINRNEVLLETLERFPRLREVGYYPEDLAEVIDVNLVSNSRLLTLAVTLPEAKLAADVANFLADRAQAYTQSDLYRGEAESARRRLDPELAAALSASAEARLARANAMGSVAALESEVTGLMDARSEILIDRAPLAVQLGAQRADQARADPLRDRVAAAQQQLTEFRRQHSSDDLENRQAALWEQRSQLQFNLLRAEADSARFGAELAATQGLESGSTALYAETEAARLVARRDGLDAARRENRALLDSVHASQESVTEELSWAELEDRQEEADLIRLMLEYATLYDRSTPTLSAMVAHYDAELAAIDASVETLRAQIGQVDTETMAARGQLTIAQEALNSLQTAHSEAALRLEEKYQGLRVVDRAIEPHYADFPRKRALTLIAALLAFLLSSIAVVVRENALAAAEESGPA
jgi:capsular polysaccharide biosynthesis protein